MWAKKRKENDMILYKGGRTIKNIKEIKSKERYCIGSFGGVCRKVLLQGYKYYEFKAEKERVKIYLDEDSLKERIGLGLVRRMLAQSKATAKTIEKLLKK